MNDIEHTLPLWLQPAQISLPHRRVSPKIRRAVQGERRDGLETGRILSGGPGHRATYYPFSDPAVQLAYRELGEARSAALQRIYKRDLFNRAAAVVTPVIAVATAAAMIFCIAST